MEYKYKLQLANVKHSIRTTLKSVKARAIVRPAITFGLFGLLVFVELYGVYYAWLRDAPFNVVMETLWDDEMQTVWASVVAFHFGTRAFGK